jgi:predicted transcriptional regulator
MKVLQLGRQGWENISEKQSIETLLGESVVKSKHKNNSIIAKEKRTQLKVLTGRREMKAKRALAAEVLKKGSYKKIHGQPKKSLKEVL